MARNQIKLTFQIGYDKANQSFERQIIGCVSRICGGCTTSHKDGWWREDGASHADTFQGKLHREHCFEIELTCEESKAERAYHDTCRAIALAASMNNVETDWVHVTETVMRGRHFSVSAMNTNAAIAAE